MPFVQRVIEPKFLSRTTLWDADGKPLVTDYELDLVTNNTLSNALRQLASLVLVANDIFSELGTQLQDITKRSEVLKVKIGKVEEKVAGYDPKKISVPESDICTFALLKNHYASRHDFDTNLFANGTRPRALRELYEAAAKTPVHLMRQMDRWRRDGHRSSRFFLCTPVLGAKRKRIRNKVDIDIETRMPAAVEELRRWTSSEALGDITVAPDCTSRIAIPEGEMTDGTLASDDEGVDHKLPSPEEQLQVVALKFPAEIVAVDVTGRSFDRMSLQRRSLMHGDDSARAALDGTGRRRTRTRKPRSRRRNTLAGTDQKEIQDALLTAGEEPSSSTNILDSESPTRGAVLRSKSSDILRTTASKRESPETKKSHFNSLKQWGRNRLKQLNRSSSSKSDTSRTIDVDDINIYETVTLKRKRNVDKERRSMHERNPSLSSSEKSSINLPLSAPLSSVLNIAVKLRESSAQRRLRRSGGNKDEPHSSSGNWSASSESGRASIGSEITTTTTHPKSTTSTCTSNNSLNLHAPSSVNSRRKFNVNTSASGSVTSEGTLTPDIIHDLHEDGETSSVYSCDTEGYYTSFHMDSGLKTLKEEELPMTPMHSTTALSNSGGSTGLTAENEYELFGKGSTSTTTSSAGTVCTTLRASESNRSLLPGPAVPERKSSLNKATSPESSLERDFSSEKTGTVKRSPSTTKATVVAVIHKEINGDVSPDSGHNTSSSPIESINSPNGIRSGSEFEFSESSDMEGPERIERIRVKTAMTTCRIPSMCVITPPVSDDESLKSHKFEYASSDIGYKNAINRPKLALPFSSSEEDKENRRVVTNTLPDNKMQVINVDTRTGYATVSTVDSHQIPEQKEFNATSTNTSVRAPSPSGGTVIVKEEPKPVQHKEPIFKASLLPLNNMLGRWKANFSNMGSKKEKVVSKTNDQLSELYDSGDYVTIADVRNNNEKAPNSYVNDAVNKNLNTVLSGKIKETEYVSLNELPSVDVVDAGNPVAADSSLERKRRQGARVTLDAEGKVIYSSDSLRRRKGAHTTFEPGPFVKSINLETKSPIPIHRTPKAIRPVVNQEQANDGSRPLSPQMGKVVIKASSGFTTPTSEVVRIPPSTIVTPSTRPLSPKTTNSRGAYVHVQDNVPTHETERVPPPEYPMCTNLAFAAEPVARHYDALYGEDAHLKSLDAHMAGVYRTLPARRTQYPPDALKPVRSVTPDITRGLTQRKYENRSEDAYSNQRRPSFRSYIADGGEYVEVARQIRDVSSAGVVYSSTPTKMGELSGREERSVISPIHSYRAKEEANESARISPIDPRNTGGFQSSTPQSRQEFKSATDLTKLLSPKKSTMSNEELYAVIHKVKKKMNIDTPTEVVAPTPEKGSPQVKRPPETGYIGDKSRSRLSWSPTKGEFVDCNQDSDQFGATSEARTRQSWACSDRKKGTQQTSRLDFKKLLLQHGKNIVPVQSKKLSAVEQLKLSKQQVESQPKSGQPELNILELSGSPRSLVNRKLGNNSPKGTPEKPRLPPKILSPRSHWRFANPRTDVVSSTIMEDCREDDSPNSSGESKGKVRVIERKISPSSISQRIQAQRAQFFGSGPSESVMQSPTEKKCSLPTLETAF